MPYELEVDPYVNPDTGVLQNLLGIDNSRDLENAEADITAAAIALLAERPVPGNFGLTHLQAIHGELFSSIYTWAGDLRTVEVTKGTTKFASAEFLEQAAKQVCNNLHTENVLKDLPDKIYAERLAHYYSEINILHPFRDGNGRTERAFFTLLAAESGRRIAWEFMEPKENLAASIAAYNGDESKLARMFQTLVQPID